MCNLPDILAQVEETAVQSSLPPVDTAVHQNRPRDSEDQKARPTNQGCLPYDTRNQHATRGYTTDADAMA